VFLLSEFRFKEKYTLYFREFNCYGGGVHNNEYDYFDYVNKMTDILNYHTISKKLRKEILKDYLDKYLNHNYSLEEKN